MGEELNKFIKDQLSVWPMASKNHRALKSVRTRTLEVGGLEVTARLDPLRVRSITADISRTRTASDCPLCQANWPPKQKFIRFEGRKERKYNIVVNPWPLAPNHIVVVRRKHLPQSIGHRFSNILDLALSYPEYVFWYNGPHCGASVPEHMHFQGIPRGILPLERDIDALVSEGGGEVLEYISSVQEAALYHYRKFLPGIFLLRARTPKSIAKLFYRLLDCAPVPAKQTEPMFNLFAYYTEGEYRAVVCFRGCHRTHHYYSEGDDHVAISPACAEMAGYVTVPSEEDFDKLDSKLLGEVLREAAVGEEVQDEIIWKLTRTQPLVEVGVLSGKEIRFEIISDGAGPQKVSFQEGKICYNGALYDELTFEAQTMSTLFAEPSFILYDVPIGKGFHWERSFTQRFAGGLKFIIEQGNVVAVNMIGAEDYLLSVISSEMRPTASLEFLKAHAVISRSWLFSMVSSRRKERPMGGPGVANLPELVTYLDSEASPDREDCADKQIIKWFDHTDHKNFDVCADDHCQRYQGLGMAIGDKARMAVDQTWGELLCYGGHICDARFSKCCGGRTETFSSCWEDIDYDYLPSLPDTPGHAEGERPYCDTSDERILSGVLNSYDLDTRDFYRWRVEYTPEELETLVRERLGIETGPVESLEPLVRGGSGRIVKLAIRGSKASVVVGKELMIRRVLSSSHLKSSDFEVSRSSGGKFILEGKGWGHGVGLCQIGAAVMGEQGFSYREILGHYYPGAEVARDLKLPGID